MVDIFGNWKIIDLSGWLVREVLGIVAIPPPDIANGEAVRF